MITLQTIPDTSFKQYIKDCHDYYNSYSNEFYGTRFEIIASIARDFKHYRENKLAWVERELPLYFYNPLSIDTCCVIKLCN